MVSVMRRDPAPAGTMGLAACAPVPVDTRRAGAIRDELKGNLAGCVGGANACPMHRERGDRFGNRCGTPAMLPRAAAYDAMSGHLVVDEAWLRRANV